ncbi:hypothetical protein [Enterococcus phage EFLK1]|uniref:Uncharacterized protein n=1 Tax=Enterococcus phage EFLK1 TaxID=1640885 RepID=A0A0E3T923_9CAUD|nr:hypothetical protein AVT53_gp187 [Enterococcus phage EFLK1]AKC04992.1 hypothetical protein [Enterococcus phage EFLK1]CAD0301134.1 Phage protein [Enterococcus phage 156]VDB76949.1 Phage protein [Enterococcus phage 156]
MIECLMCQVPLEETCGDFYLDEMLCGLCATHLLLDGMKQSLMTEMYVLDLLLEEEADML